MDITASRSRWPTSIPSASILPLLLLLSILRHSTMATLELDRPAAVECVSDLDCARIWPMASCGRRGRCQCPANQLRRPSASRGWVCLALLDVVSSSIGPPASCPLPEGAGYATIERDARGRPVFCRTGGEAEEGGQCGRGFECIQAAGQFSDQWDGICCPMAKELVCRTLPAGNGLNGRLPRFWWNGTECVQFLWAPEETQKTKCANTFTSRNQCLSFCGQDEFGLQVDDQ